MRTFALLCISLLLLRSRHFQYTVTHWSPHCFPNLSMGYKLRLFHTSKVLGNILTKLNSCVRRYGTDTTKVFMERKTHHESWITEGRYSPSLFHFSKELFTLFIFSPTKSFVLEVTHNTHTHTHTHTHNFLFAPSMYSSCEVSRNDLL